MNGARLLSVAAQRPRRIVANDDLPPELETSDEWIRTRTGIGSRGIAGEGESIIEMSTAAAQKALASAGIAAEEVDLLVVATSTMPTPTPGASPQVADRLGIRAGAIDTNGACAGFCYSLAMAADSVRAGSARNALVIGAERLTDWLDWTDRKTCVLFGDGAGAAVIGSTDAADDGIGPVVWGSDGAKHEYIAVPDFGKYLQMDGSAVFRWATKAVAEIAEEACAKAGIRPTDLAAFVPHQANMRIVELAARKLGLDERTVVADDVIASGNTSAASIPLALSKLIETGQIHRGDPALLVAFGAGMSWAAQVVRSP